LVTHSLDEYERLAERLAMHASELSAIRRKLEENRLICPLFNTDRFRRSHRGRLRTHVGAASAGKATGKLRRVRTSGMMLACSSLRSAMTERQSSSNACL
jgi:hypothetical protein